MIRVTGSRFGSEEMSLAPSPPCGTSQCDATQVPTLMILTQERSPIKSRAAQDYTEDKVRNIRTAKRG